MHISVYCIEAGSKLKFQCSLFPKFQLIMSSLVQVMACRMFSAKPLPEPMMTISLTHVSIQGIWKNFSASVQSLKPKMFFSFIHSFKNFGFSAARSARVIFRHPAYMHQPVSISIRFGDNMVIRLPHLPNRNFYTLNHVKLISYIQIAHWSFYLLGTNLSLHMILCFLNLITSTKY